MSYIGPAKIHYSAAEAELRRLMCLRIIEGGCSGPVDLGDALGWTHTKALEYLRSLKRKGYIYKDKENNIYVMTESGKEYYKKLKRS